MMKLNKTQKNYAKRRDNIHWESGGVIRTMLLFSESTAKSSPSLETLIAYGTTPSAFPSTTVSTKYPFSNWITGPSAFFTHKHQLKQQEAEQKYATIL